MTTREERSKETGTALAEKQVTAPLIATMLGCSATPPEAEPRGSAPTPEDTAAMVYSTEDPEPLLTVDDVRDILVGFISPGVPNPDEIAENYARVMALGDATCPGDSLNLYFPEQGCETPEGYYFAGIGWYDVGASGESEEGDLVELSFAHGGDFEILFPDGRRFAGGGDIEYDSVWGDDTIESSFTVLGSWVDESQANWLGRGFSGAYEGYVRTGRDRWAISITGGLGVGGTRVYLDHATWDSEDACEGALSGAIHVRDARGYWTVWDLGDDCDTCGRVLFHEDNDLGELCLDMDAWGRLFYTLSQPR